MIQTQQQFQCSACTSLIDIGDPFLATAAYPARSYMSNEAVNANYLMNQGEVLCRLCATSRIGVTALAKLKGTVFAVESDSKRHRATIKHNA